MNVPESITTTVVVENKGATDASRGTTQVKVFVEELGLKEYSTPIFVPAAQAATMEPGMPYLASLRRGNMKKDKTGDYASHYFWDWVGFGDPNVAVAQQEAAAAAPPAAAPQGAVAPGQDAWTSATVGQRFVDSKNQSIERQVAAKAATELFVGMLNAGQTADWDKWFEQVLDRIQNGPYVAPEVAPFDAEGNETPAPEATS